MGVLMATGHDRRREPVRRAVRRVVVVRAASEPFAVVGDGFATPALIGGAVVFFGIIGLLYRRTILLASRARTPTAPAGV